MTIPIVKKLAEACPRTECNEENCFTVVKIKQGVIVERIATFLTRGMAVNRLALENHYALNRYDPNYWDRKNGVVFAIVACIQGCHIRQLVSGR